MPRLNVFVDGSWLFKACAAEKALAAKTEWPEKSFPLDFNKLDEALLHHAEPQVGKCTLGSRYIATSIFSLPENFDKWPTEHHDINVSSEDVKRTKMGVLARQRFVEGAIAAGYSEEAIYRPRMKGWILERLRNKQYQEKQVDATVVALLVRSAITAPEDVHAVITGDADILPAIKVAYPKYSENVFIATTHPDELEAERRQTSFSLSNFDFTIKPLYLQDIPSVVMRGKHTYVCAHCHRAFAREKPIPVKARPCCTHCNAKRT